MLEKPQRRLLAPIVVTDQQPGPDGRSVLTAEDWLFRRTSWVRFAVFDFAAGKRVFERRHGEGRVVGSARIVSGPDRQAAFLYRDASGARHVVVNYRIGR